MCDFNQILSEKLMSLDVSDFGFADISEISVPFGESFPTAVSFVVKLSDSAIDSISTEPTASYFHHYRTVNAYIDMVTLRLGMLIESLGYRYMPVAGSQSIPANDEPYSGLISHKAVARLAGLGSIGKNALFLSHKYGPRVRLGTVLTNIPLTTATPQDNADICGDCDLCVRACPAMALKGKVWHEGVVRSDIIDAQACSEYMKSHFQHIGRGAVCGICIRVCRCGR